MDIRLEHKDVSEFGKAVRLWRVVNKDGKGTLWHRDPEKAMQHYERLAPIKGW